MDLKNFTSFVLVLLSFVLVVVVDSSSEIQVDTNKIVQKEPSKQIRGAAGMWFGPRLGRRLKRNLKFDQNKINKEQLNNLMDLIEDSPWVVLTMNGKNGHDLVSEGKRHTVNFTPRLGRDSGEDFEQSGGSPDRWLQENDFALNPGDLMAQRSPPFAPRLGRRIGSTPLRYSAFF